MVIKKKETKTKKEIKKKEKQDPAKKERYFEACGRRKTSVARVRLSTKGTPEITVNGKDYKLYFFTPELEKIMIAPLKKMKISDRFKINIKISGGGINSQAEAARHGIAKTLIKFNPDFRKRLKKAGYLKRDPRMKERRKFGLKKARKAPQWSKR